MKVEVINRSFFTLTKKKKNNKKCDFTPQRFFSMIDIIIQVVLSVVSQLLVTGTVVLFPPTKATQSIQV